MQLIKENNQLTLTDGKLSITVDFNSSQYTYRRQQPQKELIIKAIGIKKNYLPSIIDATAGLGRDAFIIASYGCEVRLLERSPTLIELLEDGLKRAKQVNDLCEITQHMQLINTDSTHYLNNLPKNHYPDVIYLDPMFPKRKKSALVKKDMQLLQALLKNDSDDGNQLLTIALERAKKRVVVKRSSRAAHLANLQPSFQYKSTACRFDIYTCSS